MLSYAIAGLIAIAASGLMPAIAMFIHIGSNDAFTRLVDAPFVCDNQISSRWLSYQYYSRADGWRYHLSELSYSARRDFWLFILGIGQMEMDWSCYQRLSNRRDADKWRPLFCGHSSRCGSRYCRDLDSSTSNSYSITPTASCQIFSALGLQAPSIGSA